MVRATKEQLEEFKESLIWQDIKDELTEQYKRAGIEYELVGETRTDDEGRAIVPNSSDTLIHLGDIKGRRKSVRYFLSIPDILISILEEEQENDSKRK